MPENRSRCNPAAKSQYKHATALRPCQERQMPQKILGGQVSMVGGIWFAINSQREVLATCHSIALLHGDRRVSSVLVKEKLHMLTPRVKNCSEPGSVLTLTEHA